jgi:hypothetical protein
VRKRIKFFFSSENGIFLDFVEKRTHENDIKRKINCARNDGKNKYRQIEKWRFAMVILCLFEGILENRKKKSLGN